MSRVSTSTYFTMESWKSPLFWMFLSSLVIGVIVVGPVEHKDDHQAHVTNNENFGEEADVKYDFTIDHPDTYDTAEVYIFNGLENKLYIWMQTVECYQCKMILLGPVNIKKFGNIAEILVDTAWAMRLKVTVDQSIQSNTNVCNMTYHFKENGNYSWYINFDTTTQNYTCQVVVTNLPDDAFIPIYIAIGVFAGLAILFICFRVIWNSRSMFQFLFYFGIERVVSSDLGTPTNPVGASDSNSINRPKREKPKRLKSLDTFRGISLVVMIFANYGGGHYWFFHHAKWNGLTVADLVFPWFIYIMGVSITLSFHAQIRHGVRRLTMFWKVFKRFLILFGLGVMLDGGTNFSTFRVPGVLQRIAISYFVVASMHLISAKPKEEQFRVTNRYYREVRDILDYWYEWLVMLALLALHICLTFFLPVPGCPTGYLGPGGPLVGENNSLENCTGGAANYIDKTILTYNHTYQHGTQMKIYHTKVPHDPEGILGTLTSIFLAFLGLQAGKIIHLYSYPRDRIIRFIVWFFLLGIIAGALCNFSKEDGLIPVNKNLWSVSFIFTTGSMAYLLLAFCYFMVDVQYWWSGIPFYFVGMNSITFYCGSEVLGQYFPFSWTPVYNTHAEMLAMNLIGTSLWVLITYYMYTINFFVKI